jgi:predicted amidohydrolase
MSLHHVIFRIKRKKTESSFMRVINVAAAQMGPIQRAESRQTVIPRMIALMDEAKARGADLIVYPELALTTFFPRWYMEDQAEVDAWFEREMPNAATMPLFARAAEYQMAMSFGYAELTPDGHHFNTCILTDKSARIVGKYRKTHLPGHSEFDSERAFQHLEKRYFEPGDTGFPVWRNMGGIFGMAICNDRRWPETYRVMGLQGVEMVVLGYNTPSVNSQQSDEGPEKRLFHNRLSVQSGAYQNAAWVVAVAKAGVEDGFPLIGGSLIVDPNGEIVAEARTEDDELLVYPCDLDATVFGKTTIFDFARHRRIEHYGLITSRVGAVPPPEA